MPTACLLPVPSGSIPHPQAVYQPSSIASTDSLLMCSQAEAHPNAGLQTEAVQTALAEAVLEPGS